ncbi:MAG: cell division ATPase MinD, partial [Candidatus Aenigmarchaeota archaeon]|nr:cell division ATPase MinD [Candidatus Aenigmarchaeota archaeon]
GKGGVGKTTLTINIGSALATEYKTDVTVVDCNISTSHLGLYLGMYYSPITINKVLTGEATIDESIYQHFTGMKIIPASLSLKDLSGVDVFGLKNAIKNLQGKTDIVLLDAAPGLGRETLSAIKASDEVLFVTTPFVPAIMDIIKMKRLVEEMDVKINGIVLNMVRKEKYEVTKDEVEKLTELPVISTIPEDRNVPKSLSAKAPIVVLYPNSPASIELKSLAAMLIGEYYEPKNILARFVEKFKFW